MKFEGMSEVANDMRAKGEAYQIILDYLEENKLATKKDIIEFIEKKLAWCREF